MDAEREFHSPSKNVVSRSGLGMKCSELEKITDAELLTRVVNGTRGPLLKALSQDV